MQTRLIASALRIALGGLAVLSVGMPLTAAAADVELAVIAPGKAQYYSTDERLMAGKPTPPERLTVEFARPLRIMKRQVSQAEYAACVTAGACRALDRTQRDKVSPALPVVGVSWEDATDYARWYSQHTGRNYRLPTYAEWVHAAGEAYTDQKRLDIYDNANPAQRWLAEYALEAQRKAADDPVPKPFGSHGGNAAGMQDVGGNVWEWTDTCNVRHYLDADGRPALPPNENCGVRVVAGSHHSLITDFMRDPKAGACSVGIPPANLGIRLVLDEPVAGQSAS